MKKISTLVGLMISILTFAQQPLTGIGTQSPTASLHVVSDNEYILKLEDNINTATSFYTIQSADNVGTFKKTPTEVFRKVQLAEFTTEGSIISTAAPSWQVTSLNITLPPGKWQITGTIVLYPSEDLSQNSNIVANCQLSISDNISSTSPSNDIISDGGMGQRYFLGSYYSPSTYETMKGNIYVNNTGLTNKTYYFIANIQRINSTTINFKEFGSKNHLENQIFALPIY